MRRAPARPLLSLVRRNAAMPRYELLLAGIFALTTSAAGGCRSCSSCHDYDPPVTNCNCDACGTHRSGSAFPPGSCGCSACSGCSQGGCSNCDGGCSTYNGSGHVEGEYSEGEYPSDGSYPMEGATNVSPARPSNARR
jgi:hypothetical protein